MTDISPAGAQSPRSPRPLPAAGRQARCQLTIGSPADVLAIVPHLLGFYPSGSLVVLGLGAPRDHVVLAFRYDLPDPPDAGVAAEIAGHAAAVLGHQQIRAVILIGYGPAALVTPVMDAAAAHFLGSGLTIAEMLRADGGRYWSGLCRDPDCCPVEGVAFDPGSHPAAAALAAAGLRALPDREALARTLEPESGSAPAIRRVTDRALRRHAGLVVRAQQAGERGLWRQVTESGRRDVQAAIRRYRSDAAITDQARLTRLAVALASLPVRDDAWARMDPRYRVQHQRLWTDVVRNAAPEFRPAPASLLAFTAWQSGEGALASVALDRALAADPGYSMAELLRDAIQAGLPPSAAQLPMTPEEVAASYDDSEAASCEDSEAASCEDSEAASCEDSEAASYDDSEAGTAASRTAGPRPIVPGPIVPVPGPAVPGSTTSRASRRPSG